MAETYVIASCFFFLVLQNSFCFWLALLRGQYNLEIFCHSPECETQMENKSGSVQNSNCLCTYNIKLCPTEHIFKLPYIMGKWNALTRSETELMGYIHTLLLIFLSPTLIK